MHPGYSLLAGTPISPAPVPSKLEPQEASSAPVSRLLACLASNASVFAINRSGLWSYVLCALESGRRLGADWVTGRRVGGHEYGPYYH